MALTVRQQIVNAVIGILAGINGQPPYSTTVDSVHDFDIAAFEQPADDVALGVFPNSYSLPRGLTRVSHAQDVKGSITLNVRGFVKASIDGAGTLKSNLIDDIGRALF